MSELAKALLAFQEDAPKLHKAAEGQIGARQYKYLDLTDAMEAIRPALNTVGVVVTQTLGETDGLRTLKTGLCHAESDEWLYSSIVLPATEDMQELGKAITYARRYSLVAMLGLVADEDVDAAQEPSGEPVEGFPVSHSVTVPGPPTKGQKGEFKELLEQLELQEAKRDPTWRQMAEAFADDQLGVKNWQALNSEQAATVTRYMQDFLIEEKWSMKA